MVIYLYINILGCVFWNLLILRNIYYDLNNSYILTNFIILFHL